MIDRSDVKDFVRARRHQLKSRLDMLQEQRLEAKLARTYTDDMDARRGSNTGLPQQYFRTASAARDDEFTCLHVAQYGTR